MTETLGMAVVGVMLLGLSQGANSTLPNAFWAEFYGTRSLGAIKSLATAVMVLGSAIGPGITGVLIDTGIIFENQMVGIALFFVFAAGLVTVGVRAARPRLPVAA
jgi:MFS family permease